MPKLGVATKALRRQTFIDAARRCVARGGYRHLSVDDVCEEAGLSKGAFYTYFDQKQDLLMALLDDDATRFSDVLADAASHRSGVEQVRRFVAAIIERGSDAAAVQLRADGWAEVASDENLRERLAQATKQQRAQLAAVIEHAVAAGDLVDVPANAFAAVLIALGDGLMLHRSLDPSGFRWPNIEVVVETLLRGLQPGKIG